MTGDAAQTPKGERPSRFRVRLSVQAQQDFKEAAFRLADVSGQPALAEAWGEGFYQALAGLATNPRGHAVAEVETRRFGRETRRLLYRRSAGSAAYHILFTIADETPDGPTVTVYPRRSAPVACQSNERWRAALGEGAARGPCRAGDFGGSPMIAAPRRVLLGCFVAQSLSEIALRLKIEVEGPADRRQE